MAQVAYASTSTKTSCTTTIPHDNTKPQNTEGTEILTCAITPANASSYLLIQFHGFFGVASAVAVGIALFVDSTADAIFATTTTPIYTVGHGFLFRVAAGSTSARTYKVRVGPASGNTVYWNSDNINTTLFNGMGVTTMSITEILP